MIDVPNQQLRKAFIQTLTRLAEQDERHMLVIGDVGFSFLEEFKARFPKQWLNAGIAEQNMMGMAAGLAAAGMKPHVYTMSNFILLRPLEQVRNDIAYANADVKLYGVKGGPSYKFLGMSHNLRPGEEMAILSTLPNVKPYFPTTEAEVQVLMKQEADRIGPAYFSI